MAKQTTGEHANDTPTLNAAIELHSAGQLQAAAEIYETLLARDGDNHDAAYGLGTVLMQQGRNDAALALLEQALSACPDAPEYAFNHAWTLERVGRSNEAANGFKRAAALAGEDPEMLVEICSRLMSLGHLYEAVDILTPASQRTPQSRILWLTLAKALGKVWHYSRALRAFERALTLDAGSAKDHLDYADLLFLAKQPEAAKKAVVRARELGLDDPAALYLEARCEQIAGNHEHERQLLHDAIAARPAYGSAWQLLLETTGGDQLEDFVDNCARLADDESATAHDRANLLYASGRALERLEHYQRAFRQFDKANECQRNAALARGLRYDRDDVEGFLKQMQAEFDVPHENATASSADAQPIFIVGMPRSGTTVVERILGGLDGVSVGGESDALEILSGQLYWAQSRAQVKPVRDLGAADWDRMAEHYWHLQTVPRSRVTDKMPTNFRHVGLICAMFPKAPIIYLRRDPRDVALSIYSRPFADAHYYATDCDSIAHFYGATQRLMSHWKSVYPERILELDYEQLVSEPERQSRRLAEFCGLEWQPECLKFHERAKLSNTFSEMQVREPLNARGVGRWRKYAESLTPFIDAFVANGVQLRDN